MYANGLIHFAFEDNIGVRFGDVNICSFENLI